MHDSSHYHGSEKVVHYYYMNGCPHCVNAKPVILKLEKHSLFRKPSGLVLKKIESQDAPSHVFAFPSLMIQNQRYPDAIHSERGVGPLVDWIRNMHKELHRNDDFVHHEKETLKMPKHKKAQKNTKKRRPKPSGKTLKKKQ